MLEIGEQFEYISAVLFCVKAVRFFLCTVFCRRKMCETMIHLMKKMSAQIVIRVMVEVGVWNFGIHLFQMKIQNDYKIVKVQQRNLRCLWIRKLMKLRVCWYYAGRLSLILKIVNRILSAEAPIFGNLVL